MSNANDWSVAMKLVAQVVCNFPPALQLGIGELIETVEASAQTALADAGETQSAVTLGLSQGCHHAPERRRGENFV
ncbi:hypothetical protein Q1J45_00805 [Pseudomonas rhodesiae]